VYFQQLICCQHFVNWQKSNFQVDTSLMEKASLQYLKIYHLNEPNLCSGIGILPMSVTIPIMPNKWPENAVRDGAWKLYHNAEIDRVELYNLQDDPFEKHNVSERNMDKVAELLELLSEWKAGLPD
jgi:hypothetical protein